MNRKGSWLWLVGILCGVWFTAAAVVLAEEPLHVQAKGKAVKKDDKIQFNDEQATQAGAVSVSKDQKFLTLTKTFEPPKVEPPKSEWKFKPFDKTTIHVDIWKNPESTSLERLVDTALVVQIRGVFPMPKNVGTYPLRSEGNLQRPHVGGGGGPAKPREKPPEKPPEFHWAAKVMDSKVDLAICSGQGGAEVSEEKEESVGAFTVANLNDTDGDSKVDNADDEVKATANGRNEVDLMKLILRKPEPDLGGKVTLKIVSGKVTLWKLPTKPKASEEKGREFNTNKLPLELWVEATDVSGKVRDIEIQMEYQGIVDTVKATGVWVDQTDVRHESADLFPVKKWKDFPAAGLIHDALASSAHFGLGYADDTTKTEFRNIIAIQFTPRPAGLKKEPAVKFDVSRRLRYKDVTKRTGMPDVVDTRDFPAQNEQANDDSHDEDESQEISDDNHLYVEDTPGGGDVKVRNVFVSFTSRNTFSEFVRVRFDGVRPTGNAVSGSRCSSFFDWHCRHTIVVDRPDPADASMVITKRDTGDAKETETNDIGSGAIVVTLP